MVDSPKANLYIAPPPENKEQFYRLLNKKNELTDKFNELMSKLKILEPNFHNYKQIIKDLDSMHVNVDEFCVDVMAWLNDFDTYQFSFQHQFEGTLKDCFQQIDFKITISTFRVGMENSKNVILTSFNNIGNWTSAIEAIAIAKKSLWISILAFLISLIALYVH